MRVPHLSPLAYRRITIVAAVLLAIIIVTGAAVRLTRLRSRLPVGPNCPKSQLQAHGAIDAHQRRSSHVNRHVHRPRVGGGDPRGAREPGAHPEAHATSCGCRGVSSPACSRRRCSVSSPSLFDLKPGFVMAHFLRVDRAPHRRAGARATRRTTRRVPRTPVVTPSHRRARTRARSVLATLVLFTGTVVTGAGPHSGGGKHDDVSRLDLTHPRRRARARRRW